MKKRDITILGILSLVIGLLYVSGLPMGLIPAAFSDIEAGCSARFTENTETCGSR